MTNDKPRVDSPEGRSFRASLVSGAAFGLGFSAIFTVIFWLGLVVVIYTVKPPSHSESPTITFKKFTPAAGLRIESQQARRTKWNLSILGVVRNDGSDPWQSIRFQISLLGTDGHLVGLCEDSSFPTLFPGQKRPFQVDCRGSEDRPLPEYATHTLEIIEASYAYIGGT